LAATNKELIGSGVAANFGDLESALCPWEAPTPGSFPAISYYRHTSERWNNGGQPFHYRITCRKLDVADDNFDYQY
jgi:hypothetical protein